MTSQRTEPRLAISFWIWALWDTGTNGFFNDLELRMDELVERGFNCIRIESGAGLTHDATGRRRGELEFFPVVPGHGRPWEEFVRLRDLDKPDDEPAAVFDANAGTVRLPGLKAHTGRLIGIRRY